MRTCRKCDTEKPESEFYTNGKYRRRSCKTCDNEARRKRPQPNYSNEAMEKRRGYWKRYLLRQKQERKDGVNTEYYIWRDSRSSDRKAGRDNDLTKEFISEQISKCCIYCGETTIRMTLDRIDNDVGHTMSNVVQSCIRCNYVRGNMPYEAFVVVARGMRRARKKGLFGTWTGRCR